jgi:NAD(P)H-dependent FMN reductase
MVEPMIDCNDSPLRVALIVGSTREGRFAPVVSGWIAALIAERPEFDLDVLDLAEILLPAVWTRSSTPALVDYRSRLASSDAFVVVTPEYNHSYPAPLKQAIDLAGGEFARKPVAFVSYGGLSGGLRAVEHLRGVFTEVRAATIREAVSFHTAWERFDASGKPHDAGPGHAAAAMLDDLAWWASALRQARQVGEPAAV